MKILKMVISFPRGQNFRHGVLYTIFSFLNSGISFILLLILARYLTPTDYGYLNLFNTFVSLLGIVITLSTVSYVGVCFFRKSVETMRKVVLISLGVTTIMLALFSVAMVLFPGFIEKSIGVPIKYLWFGLSICYFQVFNSLNLDIWRLEEKPVSYGIYGVSFAICNFLLTFLFIVGLREGWLGRVYAWSILAAIYFLISVVFLFKRRYLVFEWPPISLVKETLIFALPLVPHAVSFWLKAGLDRYIINYFHGQTIVGFYSIAANLAAIITIIGTAFNATNSVFIYKNLADGIAKVKVQLSKQTNVMTIVFFIISIVVTVFAFVLIINGLPKYQESLVYIVPLCLGGFFHCIYLLWVNYLFFYKKTKQLMFITITTALIQVILSIWLTRYSAIYTAWISMFVILLTAGLVNLLSRKILKQNENNRNSESSAFDSANQA